MDDFGGIDIGIDPGSIDYDNFGSDLSNDQIWDQLQGGDWEGLGGFNGGVGGAEGNIPVGALTQLAAASGSPNVGSPSSREISEAGGNRSDGGSEKSGKSLLDQAKSALLYDKKGDLDLGKLIKIGLGIGNLVGTRNSSREAAGGNSAATSAMLAQQLAQQAKGAWTPQQAQWSQQFLQTPVNPNRGVQYASEMRSPITPSRGYAAGGGIGYPGDTRYGGGGGAQDVPFRETARSEDIFNRARREREMAAGMRGTPEVLQKGSVPRSAVEPVGIGDLLRSLPMLFKSMGFEEDQQPRGYAEGGDVMPEEPQGALSQSAPFVGYVEGAEGGQSDLIDARLSPGEYVFDADSVSAIGDGNNAAGAAKLDEMRMAIREHKRSAPPDEIPPPMAAMNGGSV